MSYADVTYQLKLAMALTCVCGDDEARRQTILARYSSFTPTEGADPVSAKSVGRMSDKWARATLERLLDAVKDGREHFNFNEKGVRIQFQMDLLGGSKGG